MRGEKPTVCLVSSAVREGGEGRYVLELVMRADRDRHRIVVVSVERPGALALDVQRQDVPVYSLDLPEEGSRLTGWWNGTGFLRLFTLLKRLGPGLVHATGPRGALLARPAANLAGVPRLVVTHRSASPPAGLARLLERCFASHLDAVVALGPHLAWDARRRLGLHPDRVWSIDPGVDLLRVSGWPPADDLGEGRPVVGHVGALTADAGLDTLLLAARHALRWLPRLRVVIVGTGPEGVPLVRLARRLGIADHVLLAGERADVGRVLAALDAFVAPARRGAAWPAALLEAMGAGVPVVTSDLACLRHLVHDGVHGLHFPVDEPHECARALRSVVEDQDLARGLARAARDLVERRFTAAPMAARHEMLWRALLDPPRRAASAAPPLVAAGAPGV